MSTLQDALRGALKPSAPSGSGTVGGAGAGAAASAGAGGAAANATAGAASGAGAPTGRVLAAREPGPPVGVAALPRPEGTAWAKLLEAAGVRPDRDAPVAQWVQRTAGAVKQLDAQGRKREAKELARARDEFVSNREKKAWEGVKARFEALELPEKTYRALKQEEADVEKVLARLHTRRAEEWRGMAAAKLRDLLLERG